MSKILIHIHRDLQFENKLILGLMVAPALKNNHGITLFLATDGVHILNCKSTGEIIIQGTGDFYDHVTKLKKKRYQMVSGMSANIRRHD